MSQSSKLRMLAALSNRGVLSSCADAIGDTPLVSLSRVVSHLGLRGTVVAKLENLNPGYSKKDRIALQIVEDALEMGQLQRGQPVVELTSGNTGTGLAIVCAVSGNPFVAVMSRGNSPERARMMRSLGARVVLVEQQPGSVPGQVSGDDLKLVEEEAERVCEELGAFRADQFNHSGNYRAHYLRTGPEIVAACDASEHPLPDAFVDFVGSGGTFAGVADSLREVNSALKAYVVEPEGAAVIDAARLGLPRPVDPGHPIQGGGYSMDALPMLESMTTAVDGYLQVSGDEAREHVQLMARLEGVFGGYSAGANLAAACSLLAPGAEHEGGTVAMVVCDSGLKYLSSDLFEES